MEALKRQRDQLYEEARTNPASDADDMVRAFVLSGMATARPARSNATLIAIGQERRRGRLAREQVPGELKAEFSTEKVAERELDEKLRDQADKLEQVAQAARDAEAAAKAGKPMDAKAIYDRIAEIVGLRVPRFDEAQRSSVCEASGGEPPSDL